MRRYLMRKYNHSNIKKKWQKNWKNDSYITEKINHGKKFYCLDMFPYPSGEGLHVGHWRGYILSDIYARMKWLDGYEVLHPMGWDAFGLPAENFALKNKTHPKAAVKKNILAFKKQLKDMLTLCNWSKEINTTDEDYYRWTQWIFIKMFNSGLAYEKYIDVNWCDSCKTGLANEEVISGKCERCNSYIKTKNIRQWILKITNYAEQLLSGLGKLNWPEKVKTMQKNWIGKSEGTEIIFPTKNENLPTINIFTSKPETIYGVTFIGLYYSKEIAKKIVLTEKLNEVIEKCEKVFECNNSDQKNKYEIEPLGVFTHSYAVHPITGKDLPIYFINYVLKDYGTGAIMCVPAHDERDYKFATKYNLPIIPVIQNPSGDNIGFHSENGVLINSGNFDGLNSSSNGKKEIVDFIVQHKLGKNKTNYKMRDWIFSRQRYWGEPIPLIHCEKCGTITIPEEDLPLKLPYVKSYEPTGTGESPLASITSWVNTKCHKCNGKAKRETNTMPQWAGSCWYFLRYIDPECKKWIGDPEKINRWMPVDLYVGGVEHAILHLLYARFYVKFLHDKGYIGFDEPFLKLFNQGMLTKESSKDGILYKMSKSKGNVVSPDEIIEKYGVDALRLYIIFIGPPEMDCIWQEHGIDGCYRFLKKLWNTMLDINLSCDSEDESLEAKKVVNRFIKIFNERLDLFKCNTAVSAAMELVNEVSKKKIKLSKFSKISILTLLSTMIPATCAELLETLFEIAITKLSWPKYDPSIVLEEKIKIIIQVNGTTRGTIEIDPCLSKKDTETIAKEKVEKWLNSNEIKRIIHIPGKLINFVF
jgi:leucyl-tRNA synthetase